MRKFVPLLIIFFSGNLYSAECVLSLQNGIGLSSSKSEIFNILGQPVEKYSDFKNEKGAFNNGFSYHGMSFSFIDESLMSIYITNKKFALANGVRVGGLLKSNEKQIDIFPKSTSNCWCRFGIKNNLISSIEMLCPL